jgi:hypothetical protein
MIKTKASINRTKKLRFGLVNYYSAFKLISKLLIEWVSAPTEI